MQRYAVITQITVADEKRVEFDTRNQAVVYFYGTLSRFEQRFSYLIPISAKAALIVKVWNGGMGHSHLGTFPERKDIGDFPKPILACGASATKWQHVYSASLKSRTRITCPKCQEITC